VTCPVEFGEITKGGCCEYAIGVTKEEYCVFKLFEGYC
jgi:hypothetical protein